MSEFMRYVKTHDPETKQEQIIPISELSPEVIEELRTEAAKAQFVLLAVGFPEQTNFIPGDMPEPKAIKTLNKCIQAGGTPLGYLRCKGQGTNRTFEMRVLQEHLVAGDNVPGQVLTRILQIAGTSLESLGVRRLDDNRN